MLVDRRRADRAADAVAVHDLELEAEGPAQHRGGVLHLPALDRPADPRRADPLALVADRIDDVQRGAALRTGAREPGRVARRELAEAEIRAAGDRLSRKAEAQHVQKALRRPVGHVGKIRHNNRFDAPCGEDAQPLLHRRQVAAAPAEVLGGVVPKREHDRRKAAFRSRADHRAVADVQAVERAERHRCLSAARKLRPDCLRIANHAHGIPPN